MRSPTIQKLINLFSKFPTVGPRTATRFVFYLLRLEKKETEELTSAIADLKEKIKVCNLCFKSFEDKLTDKEEFCEICQDVRRNKGLLCLVANETDLEAIEKIKKYQGLYFILGGTVSAFGKEKLKKLRIKELLERVKNPEIKEIIIALNTTSEGEATALYLERLLQKNLPAGQAGVRRVTRLGRGLPVGGELEYADEETLSSALEGRK